MIDLLAWVVGNAGALGWLLLGMAVGGLLTPRFARETTDLDLATWLGAAIGLAAAAVTLAAGALDSGTGQIAGALALAGVLLIYWLAIVPRLPRRSRQRNALLDHTIHRYRFDSFLGQLVSHIILIVWSLVVLAPLWTMLVNSLKDKREIFRTPFSWPTSDIRTLDGYKSAWVDGQFDLYFRNSLTVTITSLLVILAIGALASYALANWRGRASSAIYLYFVAGLMVPIRLGTINIVTIVQDLGLSDSLAALIPIYVAMGLPITVFVLTTFMRGVPKDLIDAARMDGASEFRVFARVMLPLTRPALATVTVFNMIPIWNDLWFPLILTRAEGDRTVTYGVSLLFGQYQTDWNAILSTLSLASLPVLILYLLMSKQFIKGLTAGAVKG
ncbi:MAG: carbohydrate ABC transporter permease [Anaerolineae bacterium]|nr:carbohydrate ABC transporter permease [Anaerolineae bacterium]